MSETPDPIHRYTRAQAIADGVLVDVTETARQAGIRYPVALTRAAWDRCVRVPEGVDNQTEAGRLWDVLFLLSVAASGSESQEVRFAAQGARRGLTLRGYPNGATPRSDSLCMLTSC
jgi:hypothetical protein